MGKKETRLRWGGNQEAQRQAEEAFEKLRDKRTEKKKHTKKKIRESRVDRSVDYYAYIASAAWKRKRMQALEYYGNRCHVCGSTESLHVHHKRYACLGREKMKNLEVLCRGCHANHHEGEVLGVVDPVTAEFISIVKQ